MGQLAKLLEERGEEVLHEWSERVRQHRHRETFRARSWRTLSPPSCAN
ncbi:hypothetical protein ACN28S_33050 [Cystobacter fuscus]